jgi:hypothetical protein
MDGASVVDLIAIGPIVVGTILWRFWPPGGLGSTARWRAGWQWDSSPARGEVTLAVPSFAHPRSSAPEKRTVGREAGAPHDSSTCFVRVSPPARPSYRIGAACSLAPHVLHR